MKKLIITTLILLFFLACSTSRVEKTKNAEYKDGVTYEQLFDNYSYARNIEWSSNDEFVFVKSIMKITNDKQLKQKVIFEDQKPRKVVWRMQGETTRIVNQNSVNEIMTAMNKNEPISSRKVLYSKLNSFLNNILEQSAGRIQDAINDFL